MRWLTSILGAVVLTYGLSRVGLRLFAGLPPRARLAAAHGGSLLVLGGVELAIKSYFVSLPLEQTYVLVAPQLFWLALDALRGLADPRGVQGSNARGSRAR